MIFSSTKESKPVEQEERFAFSLSTLLLVVTVVAVSLAVGRAWGLWLGVMSAWGGLAVLAIFRRRYGWGLWSLLVWAIWIGFAFHEARKVDSAAGMMLGHQQDCYVHYSWSDSTHFDRYSAVIYAVRPIQLPSGGQRYVHNNPYGTWDRKLRTPTDVIPFPPGEEIAVVNAEEEVIFVEIPMECFDRQEIDSSKRVFFSSFRKEDSFRRSLDWDKLIATPVWQEEIAPFLLGEEDGAEADATIGP